jgi:hypothetical protein
MKTLLIYFFLGITVSLNAFADGRFKPQMQCKGDSAPWMPELGESGDFVTHENAIMATEEYIKKISKDNANCKITAIYKMVTGGNYVLDKKLTYVPPVKEKHIPLSDWISRHKDSSIDTLTYLRGRCGGLFYFLGSEYKKSFDESNLHFYIRVHDKHEISHVLHIQNYFYNNPSLKQISYKASETSRILRDKFKRIYEEKFSSSGNIASITRESFDGDLNFCLDLAGYPKAEDVREDSEKLTATPPNVAIIPDKVSPKALVNSD